MAAPAIGQRARWTPGPNATIDWSHPLAAGLRHLLLPIGGNQVVDLVTGKMCTPLASAAGGTGRYGRGLSSTAASSGVYLPLAALPPYPLSFTWAGARVGTMVNGAGIFAVTVSTGGLAGQPGGDEIEPYLYGLDQTDRFRANYANGSTYVEGSLTANDVPLGAVTTTLTIETGSQQLWVDGALDFTNANVLAAPSSAGVPFLGFHCYAQTSGRNPNVVGHLGALHGRILSASEIGALAGDPFCMIKS